jgi:hypothetical protein
MKKLFISAMVIGLIFTDITGFTQSSKEVISTLKKLQVKCQADVAYRDYRNVVDDAKVAVNLFIESADAKKTLY